MKTGSLHSFLSRLFATREIESSVLLKLAIWPLLLGFAIDLNMMTEWLLGGRQHGSRTGNLVCWPHLPDCDLLPFPDIASARLLLVLLFMLLMGSALAALKKKWSVVCALVSVLFVWKCFAHLAAHQTHMMNFQLFHLPFVAVFLFARSKIFFLRLSFATLYFLAATVKLTPSWIQGSYFSALQSGLPLFPDSSIPWITNLVILFELIGSWGLLTSNKRLRMSLLWGWVAFHIYSVTLVGVYYPLHCLPLLWILFSSEDLLDQTPLHPFSASFLLPVVALFSFAVLQIAPRLLLPDWRFSGATYQYGFDMIGANYQCRTTWQSFGKDGQPLKDRTWTSRNARYRCPPYTQWFLLKEMCERDPQITRIQYSHDVSIDGGPFFRVVDTENACALKYRPLSKIEWIKTPEEGAPIVGYPRKNYFESSFYFEKKDTPVVFDDPEFAENSTSNSNWWEYLKIFYWFLAIATTAWGVLNTVRLIKRSP